MIFRRVFPADRQKSPNTGALLDKYAPAGLLIDERCVVLAVYGDSDAHVVPHCSPGAELSCNVAPLLEERLRDAMQEAVRSGTEATFSCASSPAMVGGGGPEPVQEKHWCSAVEVGVVPLFDDGDAPTQFLITQRPLSERLHTTGKTTPQSAGRKFIPRESMSELRGPLNAIANEAYLLERMQLPDNAYPRISAIGEHARKLKRLLVGLQSG